MIQSTDFYLLSLQAVKPIPWPQFRSQLEADYAATRAKGTLAKIRQTCNLVEAVNVAPEGDEPRTITSTQELDLILVKRFCELVAPGRSPYTLKSVLMALRAICGIAEEHRYVMVSPFRLRKLGRWIGRIPRPSGKRHCSPDEVKAVLNLMRQDITEKEGWSQWRARRLFALTATLAYTGMRKTEGLLLHMEDLDLDRGVIDLKPRTKTGLLKTEGSAQPIAVPMALVPILREWTEHRLDHPAGFTLPPVESIPWLFPGSMRRGPWVDGVASSKPWARIKAVSARAGVVMTPQALRRSFATRAESLGILQPLITRQLRHADERTTQEWYQQRELNALREALEGFDY